ncbi:hypothetical protein FRC17_001566 [Serendipita sp. 399]|nr:hypothetical protein FRC17_001566 [Serendipita sp. 399]
MQPGPRHTAVRKFFRQTLGPQMIAKYDPVIQKHSEELIKTMHNFEGDPFQEVVSAVGAIVISVAYGENVNKDHGQELTQLSHDALSMAIFVMTRFWLVEIVPSLKRIPAWTPGATFRRIGIKATKMTSRIYNWPWEESRRHYNEGNAGPCIAADCFEKGSDLSIAQDSVTVMFGAGVNTTTTVVLNFLYAMMLHPHIQRKVQAELDDQIGQTRLISGADLPNLPYAEAAWRESFRWHAPVPLGVARRTYQADVYNGVYIPKDSMITLNVEFMLRDPRVFDQPEVYQPERWLEHCNPKVDELPDPITIAFGFGTRICPGRYLAERAGFALAMSLLSAYDLVPANGGPIPDWRTAAWIEHGDSRPIDFNCAFKPRSDFSANLLSGH